MALRAPHDEADGRRVLAVVGQVARQQRVAERDPDRPRRSATGSPWGRRSRSCARSAARRPARGSASRTGRPARTRRTARAAGCRARRSCGPAAAPPRRRRSAAPRSTSGTSGRAARRRRRAPRRPAGGVHGQRPARAPCSSSRSAADAVVLRQAVRRAERAAQPRQRAGVAAPGLLRAQDAQHQVDARQLDRRLPEHVQPVADEDVLDLAQVAVDVQQEVVELLLARRLRRRAGRGAAGPPRRAPRSAPRIVGSLAGSIAWTWAYSSSSCSSWAISS